MKNNHNLFRGIRKVFKPKQKQTETVSRKTINDVEVSFVVNEAYNTLRTNISFALATQKSNIFLVSSPVQGEGKSTTVSNIAISMAKTGARVVVIDSDMRCPVQHKLFKTKNEKGLSTVLGGMSKLENSIHRNVFENLDVITAGTIPPNPSELVNSDNMKNLLTSLSTQYDYVIIDTPPINVVSDALVLSKYTAGVVLVVRQNSTTYDDINRVMDNMSFSDCKILGVIINDMKDFGSKKAYKSRYYYRYEYKPK